MNPLRLRAALVVGVLVFTVGCGGSDSPSSAGPSPTDSNTPAPAPTSGGATVSGTASGGGQSALIASVRLLGAGLAGVTVGVEGTHLSTRTGLNGAFELRGVPSGLVRLRFQGSGASGVVELTERLPVRRD